MEIKVELTEQDHNDFYKDYGFKRNWIQRVLILLLIALVASLFLQKNTDDVEWSRYFMELFAIVIILFPFFFVIPYFIARTQFKKAYNNNQSPVATRIFRPFAIGIEIIQGKQESFLRYENVKTAGKAGRYVYLVAYEGTYFILPGWCFLSYPDIDHFLRIVKSGMANEKGTKSKFTLQFKPIYLAGLLCFIPGLGVFVGIVLITLGASSYKDKMLVIIGVLGIFLTFGFFSYVTHSMTDSPEFNDVLREGTQVQLNELVKNIEFYKLQNGAYPDSLQQLESRNNGVAMDDPIQIEKHQKNSTLFNYHRMGNKYVLFSSGFDGKPNTRDDIYPTIDNPDTSKLGFVRK